MIINHKYDKKKYFERDQSFFNKRLNELISIIPEKKLVGKFLDAGSGAGEMLEQFKNSFPNLDLYGTDISAFGLKAAEKKGFTVFKSDLSEKINYKSNYFNVVFSQSVIEHLYNPDLFLEECNRVMKKNGMLIILTPNFLAWYQRILCLLGIMPTFMELSTKDPTVGLGPISGIFHKDHTVGHIRVFNKYGLEKVIENSGFKILKSSGLSTSYSFPQPIRSIFAILDRLATNFSSLSSVLCIIAVKK